MMKQVATGNQSEYAKFGLPDYKCAFHRAGAFHLSFSPTFVGDALPRPPVSDVFDSPEQVRGLS